MKKLLLIPAFGLTLALSACGEFSEPVPNSPNTYLIGDDDGDADLNQAFKACKGNVQDVRWFLDDDDNNDKMAWVTCGT